MNIGILYLCMSFIYILLVCLDGEDVKQKWKQWLADKLGIKPKIEVRYIKPQVVKLHSRVTMSNFEMWELEVKAYYLDGWIYADELFDLIIKGGDSK